MAVHSSASSHTKETPSHIKRPHEATPSRLLLRLSRERGRAARRREPAAVEAPGCPSSAPRRSSAPWSSEIVPEQRGVLPGVFFLSPQPQLSLQSGSSGPHDEGTNTICGKDPRTRPQSSGKAHGCGCRRGGRVSQWLGACLRGAPCEASARFESDSQGRPGFAPNGRQDERKLMPEAPMVVNAARPYQRRTKHLETFPGLKISLSGMRRLTLGKLPSSSPYSAVTDTIVRAIRCSFNPKSKVPSLQCHSYCYC